ncbi:MAG: isoprenylcysteine carboxylmethyltransferase family protein [Gemmatimonadetes bacterium]|nr:isoprenylcysteine carboxylmethyltransferase family protein [Gemmatimonadota bacterium]
MFVKGTRTRAILGSFVFFWVAPGVVAGVGPFALFGWTMQPPLLGLPGERVVGVAAVGAGLACLLDCFSRFALEGRGTPAPVAQTEVLVVSGLYRFVRNPMYVSVLIIISGQALLFGHALLFAYAGVVLVAFHLNVLFYEEPRLRRRFGGSYETYSLNVGRWWPRLTPWRGSSTSAS